MTSTPPWLKQLANQYATGMMDAVELELIGNSIIDRVSRRPGFRGLEIGAYVGRTTLFSLDVFQHLNALPTWIAVDPFELLETADAVNPRGLVDQYLTNIRAHPLRHRVTTIIGTSEQASAFGFDNLDLVIVDGYHSEEICGFDIREFSKRVTPGGYMMIDDYGGAYPGVVAAVDAFMASEQARDFQMLAKHYYVLLQRKEP